MNNVKSRQRTFNLTIVIIAFLTLVLLPMQASYAQSSTLRVGLMGDSATDEYRGTDNRGGSYASVTYNWIEQLVLRGRMVAGAWGSRSEPRRLGFANNWARSGATSESLLQQGQHTGVAGQAASGQLDVVIIMIGSNDFAPYYVQGYEPIYSGSLSGTALTNKINSVIQNITTAVDTVRAARVLPMIINTVPDWSQTTTVLYDPRFSDPAKRQRVSNAIAQVNAGLISMANARGLGIFDSMAFNSTLQTQIQNGHLNVGGQYINMAGVGNDPRNAILADNIHVGTVIEGLVANQYLTLINQLVSPDVALLSDADILMTAGLISSGGGSTNTAPTAVNDTYSTNEDTTLNVGAPGVLNNDSDPQGNPLLAGLVSNPTKGTVTLNSNGSFTYTPNTNANGTDSFTYRVYDGALYSSAATVTININSVNDTPIARNDLYTTPRNTAITLTIGGLLSNDTDADGDTLTAVSNTFPVHGSLAPINATTFRYIPHSNFTGTETFTYTISDGRGGTSTASIIITVTP